MNLDLVSAEEYRHLFPKPCHVFNSVDFIELNKDKCSSIQYLSFSDKKARLGLVIGEKGDGFHSPFSAPFGAFDANQPDRIEYYNDAINLLMEYLSTQGTSLRLVLPPSIYGSFVAKIFNVLSRNGAIFLHSDLNYAYELERWEEFEDYLDRSARKNFHNSLRYDFEFLELDRSVENISRVYSVIRANRDSKGYPLRMSLDSVLRTSHVVSAEFFIMTLNDADVAAAMVYPVTEGINQVVYWGDHPGYSEDRPMNFFTYKLFEHYYKKGLRILDIGPSSEAGIPNIGLCAFKENLGCSVSLKHTFLL